MKQSTWLIIMLAVVLFLSGATAGFFIGRLTLPRPPAPPFGAPPPPEKFKAKMSERILGHLKLTEAQQKAVSPAMDRWFEQLADLRRKGIPDVQRVFNELFDNLKQFLDKEQLTELENIRKQTMENLSRDGRAFPRNPPPTDRKHNPPPPPPPI